MLWGSIITAAAPALFFLSLSSLNPVGDTYFDWNSDAVFTLEARLYWASGVGLLVAVAGLVAEAVQFVRVYSRRPHVAQTTAESGAS